MILIKKCVPIMSIYSILFDFAYMSTDDHLIPMVSPTSYPQDVDGEQ